MVFCLEIICFEPESNLRVLNHQRCFSSSKFVFIQTCDAWMQELQKARSKIVSVLFKIQMGFIVLWEVWVASLNYS